MARKTAAFIARRSIDVGPPVDYKDDEHSCIFSRVINMLNYKAVDFAREHMLLVVCSTTGDGVPPSEAESFRDSVRTQEIELPSSLPFALLALGDSRYLHFCRGGVIFEELLRNATGKSPVIPRVDIDQEDWSDVLRWAIATRKAVNELARCVTTSDDAVHEDYLADALRAHAERSNSAVLRYSRTNPYVATLTKRESLCATPNRRIVDMKNVIRVELAVDPCKLPYMAGDALGVLPKNNAEAVAQALKLLAANGDEVVLLDGANSEPVSLEMALTERLDLRAIRAELVVALRNAATSAKERETADGLQVVDNGGTVTLSEAGHKYASERHVVDALSDFGSAQLQVDVFARLLRTLQTRYYSISSSPVLCHSSIACTLDVVRYVSRGVSREGVASTYLNDRVRIGDEVCVFVSRNNNFRLPVDTDLPVVMIAAGTGIAPFMAFIKERVATHATGDNVLFFGCRYAYHDFLYADRLREWAENGSLVLHAAFSRDQEEKIYVTTRLREQRVVVWEMLQKQDAHAYVCGYGGAMARDVHDALRDVVEVGGEMTSDEAEAFLELLQTQRRYQRDVWVS